MFSSSTEPQYFPSTLTVQLPGGCDVSVHTAARPKKIVFFSSWMKAWNVYFAISVAHMPSRAPSLI